MTDRSAYDLVKPTIESGMLTEFSQIFTFDKLLSISMVAEDLGKGKTRFKELVDNPDEFIYQEIRLFANKCQLKPYDISLLIEKEHPGNIKSDIPWQEQIYAGISKMIEKGDITKLNEIITYTDIEPVAERIGRKGATLSRYLKNVDNFPLGDIRKIGNLFKTDFPTMMKLVDAQYDEQINSNRKT